MNYYRNNIVVKCYSVSSLHALPEGSEAARAPLVAPERRPW